MLTRRNLIQTAATTGGGLAAASLLAPSALGALAPAPAPRPRFRGKLGKLQLLQVGVAGSIAPADRHELKNHPDVVFTGFCDVDSNALSSVAAEHPDAFTCRDFREAFDKHGDRFDAVVVCTPDHNHALITLWAMRANKHVYAQKPLVQQLSEVVAIEEALAARPQLVTQTGNQRMGPLGPAQRLAVANDVLEAPRIGTLLIEQRVRPEFREDGYPCLALPGLQPLGERAVKIPGFNLPSCPVQRLCDLFQHGARVGGGLKPPIGLVVCEEPAVGGRSACGHSAEPVEVGHRLIGAEKLHGQRRQGRGCGDGSDGSSFVPSSCDKAGGSAHAMEEV